MVNEYTYEESVVDDVNVPFDEYVIGTEIGKNGAQVKARQRVKFRGKKSRKQRWGENDDDVAYRGKDLDKDIVNPSQIRNQLHNNNPPNLLCSLLA